MSSCGDIVSVVRRVKCCKNPFQLLPDLVSQLISAFLFFHRADSLGDLQHILWNLPLRYIRIRFCFNIFHDESDGKKYAEVLAGSSDVREVLIELEDVVLEDMLSIIFTANSIRTIYLGCMFTNPKQGERVARVCSQIKNKMLYLSLQFKREYYDNSTETRQSTLSFLNSISGNQWCAGLRIKKLNALPEKAQFTTTISALSLLPTLQLLRLIDVQLNVEGLRVVVDGIRQSTSITDVSVGMNLFGDKGIEIIAQMLMHDTKLQKLYLFQVGMRRNGAAVLAEALVHNNTLRFLELGGNFIGSRGARSLTCMLRQNSGLTTLLCFECAIGTLGALEFAKALSVNKTLRRLDLSDNCFHEDWADEIRSKALQQGTLTSLSLSRRGYREEIGFPSLLYSLSRIGWHRTLGVHGIS